MKLWRITQTTITMEVMLEQEKNRRPAIARKLNVLSFTVIASLQVNYAMEIVIALVAITHHPVKNEQLRYALLWIDNLKRLDRKFKVIPIKKDVIVLDQAVLKNIVSAILLE
jgi:hypothetical protein